MGDLELSLDDIIKKKLEKSNVSRNRKNGVINRRPIRRLSDQGNRYSNKTSIKLHGGITKNIWRPNIQMNTPDARLKIIQKNREKIVDARDKLEQIAKQTDARLRLMKLREQQIVRGNIVRGTIPQEQMIQRTIHPSVCYENELMDFNNDMTYMARNYAPDAELFHYQFRNRQDLPVIYRTVENDVSSSNRLLNPDQNRYSWKNPKLSPTAADNTTDIPVKKIDGKTIHSPFKNEESSMWDYNEPPIVITKRIKPMETVGILKKASVGSSHEGEQNRIVQESPSPAGKSKGHTKTLSERFCQDGNSSAQKISLLKAKLGATNTNKLSNAKDKEPLGHRIVVSNLVPSVTHEDVRELFEDIGELISSKVVRPGTAEVIYKLHKDAVKAVDVYHNRQLDGQPMKCLLVNNRSLPIASKALKLEEAKAGKGIIELDMTAFRKALHKNSSP